MRDHSFGGFRRDKRIEPKRTRKDAARPTAATKRVYRLAATSRIETTPLANAASPTQSVDHDQPAGSLLCAKCNMTVKNIRRKMLAERNKMLRLCSAKRERPGGPVLSLSSFLSPSFVSFGYGGLGCGRRPRCALGPSVVSIRAKQSQFAPHRPGRTPAGRAARAATAGDERAKQSQFLPSDTKGKHFVEKEL
jgi:hypothetical protein